MTNGHVVRSIQSAPRPHDTPQFREHELLYVAVYAVNSLLLHKRWQLLYFLLALTFGFAKPAHQIIFWFTSKLYCRTCTNWAWAWAHVHFQAVSQPGLTVARCHSLDTACSHL